MRKLFLLLFIIGLVGCTTADTGYKKVAVDASQAAALSNLSDMKLVSNSESISSSISKKEKKIVIPGFIR